MASVYESASTQEILKTRYGTLSDNVPSFAICEEMFGALQPAQKIGNKFVAAATLQVPHGHTYNGASSTLGTAFTLNDANPGVTQDVEAYATEYMNRDFVPTGLVSKALSAGPTAFAGGMDLIMKILNTSTHFALEEMTLYGARWIGEVSGAGFGDAAPTNSGANDLVIFVTKREWAAGLCAMRVGSLIDVYSAVGTWPNITPTTLRNATGTVKVKSIIAATRQITLTFSVAAERAGVVETDVFMPKGTLANWSDGIASMAYKSAAGSTLFGVNSSLYPFFQASGISLSSTLTQAKVFQIAANMTAKCGPRDLTCLTSPWSFNDLGIEQAGYRRYDSSYSDGKFTNGADGSKRDSLTLYGPNGRITVLPHPMVKAGEVMLLDFSLLSYIGSSMPTFTLNGSTDFFIDPLPDGAGAQFRQWFDLAPFTANPSALGIGYGLTPSGLA